MEYKELLKKYILESGMSLREIEEEMKQRGFSSDKAYISKLQNGKLPPAGEDITRALAEVTSGDPEALLLAGYIEKAPNELKPMLAEASNSGYLVKNEELVYESPANYKTDLDAQTQKKIDFFRNLESDLGLDLTDVEVQKKLKRAAKIIFSSED